MIIRNSTVNRKRLFSASVLLLFVAMSVLQMTVSTEAARAVKTKGPIFEIVPDNAAATLSNSSVKGGTFYLEGKIYPFKTVNQATCALPNNADERVLGIWRAWGTVADNSGHLVLHQTLLFKPSDSNPTALNGTIEVQGVTGIIAPNGDALPLVSNPTITTGPSEILSVVGGTGAFHGASGAASIRPYCNPNPAGTSPFRFDRAFCFNLE